MAGEKLDELAAASRGNCAPPARQAAALGSGMWALRKDEKKLTPGQRGTLAQIAVTSRPLCKGYLIKEQIREAFKVKADAGKSLMRGVTACAHRCRIPEFTRLAKTLSRYKDSVSPPSAAARPRGPERACGSSFPSVVRAGSGVVKRRRNWRADRVYVFDDANANANANANAEALNAQVNALIARARASGAPPP